MITPEWKELLITVARAGANHAEQVAEIDKTKETPLVMRDRFAAAEEHLQNDQPLTKEDFNYLWIAASISKMLIQKKINAWEAVVKNYNSHLLPNLYAIASAPTDEERQTKFEEVFGQNFDKI